MKRTFAVLLFSSGVAAASCTDLDWMDDAGNACSTINKNWCQKYGNELFTKGGLSGNQACCVCGGGQSIQAPLPTTTAGGFDFGDDCQPGTGTFPVIAATKQQFVDVGVIPAGKFNIRVELSAAADLDISLFDLGDTSRFPEGQAVVQWCKTANLQSGNCGILGQNALPQTLSYKEMMITYSGYNGQDGKKGQEFISLQGMSSTPLMMKAFAYQAGAAQVQYSYGAGCGGSFTALVKQNELIVIGDIPVGVTGLSVTLNADADVDIQLYDVSSSRTQASPAGTAIVAYCSPQLTCNYGPITSSGSITGSYAGLTYAYSGWDGVTGGGPGNERVEVKGSTNRPLRMMAFGYKQGQAKVTYTYTSKTTAQSPTPQPTNQPTQKPTAKEVDSGPFKFPVYNQQCQDDAGPLFGDDAPGFSYHSGSLARAVLQDDGTCHGPVAGACAARAGGGPVTADVARAAYLEGPLDCGGKGWFCRIIPDAKHDLNKMQGDYNFAHCNRTEGNDGDADGHCHGSDHDDVFYWWVRDHWHRNYAGRLHCCCDWEATKDVVTRCDYRAKLLPGENDECRDANEDHMGPGSGMSKGYEAGCTHTGVNAKQAAAEPGHAQCWDVEKFAPGPDV